MKLFWKIFAWFWSAMVVMGAALFGVITATQPDPLPQAWRQATGQALSLHAVGCARAFERGGATGLSAVLHQLHGDGRTRLWLFDSAGRFIVRPNFDKPSTPPPFGSSDFGVSNGVQRFDSFGRPDGAGPRRGPLPRDIEALLLALVKKALYQEDGEAQFQKLGRNVLVAQSVAGTAGRRYVLAGEMSSPPGGRAPIESGALMLRLCAVLGTGTLGCYGLARYLSAPIISLRTATQRLAEGDLQARSGGQLNGRRDELGELGRDFDRMAGRIEELMLSERRSVEAQRRLLGDVSHELRSPLTRLSVALALARHYETSLEVRQAHERIGIEATRLNDLIGQLLQLARLESGAAEAGSEARSQTVDVEALVREVVEDARFEARERGRGVRVAHLASCLLPGDAPLLRSAIENVVRNGARHTAEGTEVEVSLRCESDKAIITVRDHGVGVPEQVLGELFKPFYRVESARDRESGGVGLGLAITERAVTLHGGVVTARNAPGGGLEVEIRLPTASGVQGGG